MATGNNGGDNTTRISSVDGALQVHGTGDNSTKGGFRVGEFNPNGTQTDQLGEGYLLAKKDIMTQTGLYAYSRKGPTTQKGAPAKVVIFSKTGRTPGGSTELVDGVGMGVTRINTSAIKFPCRGIYRFTAEIWYIENGSTAHMRSTLRFKLYPNTGQEATAEGAGNEVGNIWFSEGEHGSFSQEQHSQGFSDCLIDPTGADSALFNSGKGYLYVDVDDVLGVDEVNVFNIAIELIAPLSSGAEYIYEG
jgi:hypothetical protein